MSFEIKGRWAVVTGASSGIGKAIAEELAGRGCNLYIVARRENLLQESAEALSRKHGVEVIPIALDLAAADAAETLAERVSDQPVSILINNAGIAVLGPFLDGATEHYETMINLNVRFLTRFTHAMLPRLQALDLDTRVVNIGSVAGYQGVPRMAAYAATKAYVNHLSEGLNWELRGTRVRVCCVEPGQTASEFFERAGVTDAFMARFALLRTETVARAAVQTLIKGKSRQVVGGLNKMLVFSLRIFPRWAVRLVVSRMFADMG